MNQRNLIAEGRPINIPAQHKHDGVTRSSFERREEEGGKGKHAYDAGLTAKGENTHAARRQRAPVLAGTEAGQHRYTLDEHIRLKELDQIRDHNRRGKSSRDGRAN